MVGNYIVTTTESHDKLPLGLQDIHEEAEDLKVLTTECNIYKTITFWVGTDHCLWKLNLPA